ncbi:hypothetical protein U9M48_017516 [Paspalum notatum var. saurae]|uniref:Uncharacterized protein n=1 Tax=Paspalum notatum var. saurae TaxID=547442 RepID=A0AAQ3WNX5_PASNO
MAACVLQAAVKDVIASYGIMMTMPVWDLAFYFSFILSFKIANYNILHWTLFLPRSGLLESQNLATYLKNSLVSDSNVILCFHRCPESSV